METRKPFLSIAGDVDDDALEAVARLKGVPSLTPALAQMTPTMPTVPAAAPRAGAAAARGANSRAGQGDEVTTSLVPSERGPTPRRCMSYVKACLPDYALTELKTRALQQRVSINHILLKALDQAGIRIKPDDLVEDGRRLRGRHAYGSELV
jgi:hypothetical protein